MREPLAVAKSVKSTGRANPSGNSLYNCSGLYGLNCLSPVSLRADFTDFMDSGSCAEGVGQGPPRHKHRPA
jgi:hypothetical protein